MSTLPLSPLSPTPHVVVFGSINMDLVVRTPRFVQPGETLIGSSFFAVPGGKGANQAVACARLGVSTHMVGRVGHDTFGDTLLESLRSDGVKVDAVVRALGSSGVAVIDVEDSGENRIVVVPGANAQVGAEDLKRLERVLEGAAVLLLQLEVPLEVVLQAARLARARGVTVVLDPAPAQTLPHELYALTDFLTPNASEAASLVGFALEDNKSVLKAGRELLSRGVREVILKRGGNGVTWMNAAGGRTLPTFQVTVVDTVAAGDAFNGGLAAALCEGRPLEEALRWGMATGALSVTKLGAQSSLPHRVEMLELLTRQDALLG